MRKLAAFFLCAVLLLTPVRAEDTKYAVLTFDDGPSGRFTSALLDGLKERNVKATFLLCGYRIKDYPDLTRRIRDEGHEIGLHGYSHGCMAAMPRSKIDRELSDTMALLPEGCCPAFLRPPGGNISLTVQQAAQDANLAILTWSIDPRDWEIHDAAAVEREVVEHVHDGDVILLHDMSDSSVAAALAIVDALQEQGYVFCTASELASVRGVSPEPGKVYSRFR